MKRAAVFLGGSALGGAVLALVVFLVVAWVGEQIARAEEWS